MTNTKLYELDDPYEEEDSWDDRGLDEEDWEEGDPFEGHELEEEEYDFA